MGPIMKIEKKQISVAEAVMYGEGATIMQTVSPNHDKILNEKYEERIL